MTGRFGFGAQLLRLRRQGACAVALLLVLASGAYAQDDEQTWSWTLLDRVKPDYRSSASLAEYSKALARVDRATTDPALRAELATLIVYRDVLVAVGSLRTARAAFAPTSDAEVRAHESTLVGRLTAAFPGYSARQGDVEGAAAARSTAKGPNAQALAELATEAEGRAKRTLQRLRAAPGAPASVVKYAASALEYEESAWRALSQATAGFRATVDAAEAVRAAVVAYRDTPSEAVALAARQRTDNFARACAAFEALVSSERAALRVSQSLNECASANQRPWYPADFRNALPPTSDNSCPLVVDRNTRRESRGCSNDAVALKAVTTWTDDGLAALHPARLLFLSRGVPAGPTIDERALERGEPVVLVRDGAGYKVQPLLSVVYEPRDVDLAWLAERPLPGLRRFGVKAEALAFDVPGRDGNPTRVPPLSAYVARSDQPPLRHPDFVATLDPSAPLVAKYAQAEERFFACFEKVLDRLDPSGVARDYDLATVRGGSVVHVESLAAVHHKKACGSCGCAAINRQLSNLLARAFAAPRSEAFARASKAAARVQALVKGR